MEVHFLKGPLCRLFTETTDPENILCTLSPPPPSYKIIETEALNVTDLPKTKIGFNLVKGRERTLLLRFLKSFIKQSEVVTCANHCIIVGSTSVQWQSTHFACGKTQVQTPTLPGRLEKSTHLKPWTATVGVAFQHAIFHIQPEEV